MTIPITLLAFSLSKKIVNQLRLYLYLKSVCSGHFFVSDTNIRTACDFLKIKSEKTFRKNLRWLIKNKWVAYNSKTGSCRIISFARLCHKLNIGTKTGVVFSESDFQTFRPFIYAAVISWRLRRKNWLERQPARKKGRASKSMSKPKFQLPNRYLAKILELDHSTISRYKLAASEAGYIIINHHFDDTELPEKFKNILKKSVPEEAHLFVMHNKTVQRQLPDTITTNIHLKHCHLRAP